MVGAEAAAARTAAGRPEEAAAFTVAPVRADSMAVLRTAVLRTAARVEDRRPARSATAAWGANRRHVAWADSEGLHSAALTLRPDGIR